MNRKLFVDGFVSAIPLSPGIIPFGAVMGSICAEANLTLFQTFGMNFFVFAGASQLAAIDLMKTNAAVLVILATAMIINLRFLLYSAALSPLLHNASFLKKLIAAHNLTDQSYAVLSANQSRLPTPEETLTFYLGTAASVWVTWHLSVLLGFVFGNFAPPSLALDYAIPVSFVALLIPTLKNKTYVAVAVFSTFISILFHSLPYKAGLIATAAVSMAFAISLTRRTKI